MSTRIRKPHTRVRGQQSTHWPRNTLTLIVAQFPRKQACIPPQKLSITQHIQVTAHTSPFYYPFDPLQINALIDLARNCIKLSHTCGGVATAPLAVCCTNNHSPACRLRNFIAATPHLPLTSLHYPHRATCAILDRKHVMQSQLNGHKWLR